MSVLYSNVISFKSLDEQLIQIMNTFIHENSCALTELLQKSLNIDTKK